MVRESQETVVHSAGMGLSNYVVDYCETDANVGRLENFENSSIGRSSIGIIDTVSMGGHGRLLYALVVGRYLESGLFWMSANSPGCRRHWHVLECARGQCRGIWEHRHYGWLVDPANRGVGNCGIVAEYRDLPSEWREVIVYCDSNSHKILLL